VSHWHYGHTTICNLTLNLKVKEVDMSDWEGGSLATCRVTATNHR